MSQKYYCEFCGKRFHSAMAAIECARTPACRGFGFPPEHVVGSWKVRGCAIILATTAAELIHKSPAGKTNPKVRELGDNILKWAKRVEEALCANTPLSLGKRTRLHNGLVDFVWSKVWTRGDALPNLHAIDLAAKYAFDAKEYVQETIESTLTPHFWFEHNHPEWLLYDCISVPLAVYITKMKGRNMVDKDLDLAIQAWGKRSELTGEYRTPAMLSLMLKHCWRDELRSWNFLLGALDTARKWILKNGTPASLDLSRHDTDKAYETLLTYIWDDPESAKPSVRLKLWLVNNRFWVAAKTRARAKEILTRDSGHVPREVRGIDKSKKLYDSRGQFAETAEDILKRITEEQLVGVE